VAVKVGSARGLALDGGRKRLGLGGLGGLMSQLSVAASNGIALSYGRLPGPHLEHMQVDGTILGAPSVEVILYLFLVSYVVAAVPLLISLETS
jgi:hypothetical protein